MARHDNREWVPAVRVANGTHRTRSAELLRDLAVGSCFTKWNRQEGVPDTLLKWGTPHVKWNGEALPLAFEVFFQLLLCLDQEWVAIIIAQIAENYSTGIVILPKNRH